MRYSSNMANTKERNKNQLDVVRWVTEPLRQFIPLGTEMSFSGLKKERKMRVCAMEKYVALNKSVLSDSMSMLSFSHKQNTP